jgi:hypothetical protein
MEENRFENFIKELSDIISNKSCDYIIDILKVKGEENTSDLINLLISSHISSMFNCMRTLSQDNKEIQKKVYKFENDLISFMDTIMPK